MKLKIEKDNKIKYSFLLQNTFELLKRNKLSLSEKENYSKMNVKNYELIEKNIINSIEYNQNILFLISNLISNKYGALG